MRVHWHPDNLILLKDDDGSVVYRATPEEASQDLGSSIGSLPLGINERQYKPGILFADFDGFTKHTRQGNWSDGDMILLMSDDLISKYQSRLTQ
jgi:hypothetical protein